MIEGCDFFIRTIANELRLWESMNKETISKLESHLKEVKAELNSLKDTMDSRIWAAELDKAHLAAKEQTLKE